MLTVTGCAGSVPVSLDDDSVRDSSGHITIGGDVGVLRLLAGDCFILGADEIETVEDVVERVRDILQYFSPDKVYLNPDCGFGTFAERNVNTPEIAEKKLQVMSEAAIVLRAEFG